MDEMVKILLAIKGKITDDSDLLWTSYETAEEIRVEIDELLLRLKQNDIGVWKDIYFHFLPTSTFQEHAIQNGWATEYMRLADRFDKLYERYK